MCIPDYIQHTYTLNFIYYLLLSLYSVPVDEPEEAGGKDLGERDSVG